MEIPLSLAALFQNTWGYATHAFDPAFKGVIGDTPFTRVEAGKLGSPYYATDIAGREYYLPIEVQVGHDLIPGTETSYAQVFGVTDSSGAYTGRWNLPYPVMSSSLNIHIIDTELTERDGMVSELINIGGWKIRVRGMMINQNNEYPEDDFDILNRLAGLKVPVRIGNVLTDLMLRNSNSGDPMVTIRNLSFPERAGVKHARPYELELWSDVPFNLEDIS